MYFSLLAATSALQDCNSVFSSFENFTGQCNNKWTHLKPFIKPTQPQVGFAWIQYKIWNDFQSESDAQKEINSKPTPAVIGPGPAFYIVDDHHTLCALDYAGYKDVSVTLTVLCDRRNMSVDDFWADMLAQNFAYLASHPKNKPNNLPISLSYTDIPQNFSFDNESISFTDDNWRALAGFSRKVESVPASNVQCNTKLGDIATCERCFYRGCMDGYQQSGFGVPFIEFRWSYFMNDGYLNTSLWDNKSDYSAFVAAYNVLNIQDSFDPYTIVLEDWLRAASYMVPLCRSKSGRQYEVSKSIFSGDAVLPGYYEGYIKLPADPACDVPVCK